MASTKKVGTKKTKTAGNRSPGKTRTAKRSSAANSEDSEAARTGDRRSAQDRRKTQDRRENTAPVAVQRRLIERRAKVNRRRQIDPTTCERDYSSEEIEFMSALDEYKRTSGRMFPTCSEILEVIRDLGYQKPPAGDPAQPSAPETDSQPSA